MCEIQKPMAERDAMERMMKSASQLALTLALEHVESAVEAEREACAKIADHCGGSGEPTDYSQGLDDAAKEIAAKIRARAK